MKNIKFMFFEITVSSLIILLLDSLITAVAVFSVFYFLLIFFRIDVAIAIIAAIVFFIFSFVRKIRVNKVLKLEERYPSLYEKLRTSRDYVGVNNKVVNSLNNDVINNIKKADIDTFLNSKHMWIKVCAIILALMLTITFSSFNVYFFDVNKAVAESPFTSKIIDFAKRIVDRNADLTAPPEYLDDPNLAKLGTDEMNISLNVFNTEIDPNKIDEPIKHDYQGQFPDTVGGYGQKAYEDKISEEDKEIIKKYFDKVG
jgi:hypothetical protein